MPSERVLVVMKGFLGDAVMATPLIDGLIAAGREVTIATTPVVEELLRAPDRPFAVIPTTRSRKLADTWKLARAFRKGKFRRAFLVNRSMRSAMAVFMALIRTRSGHSSERRKFLLTRSLPYDLERSEAECYLDLARITGLDLPFVEPRLFVSPEEREQGRKLLEGATVAVQPGASFWGKRIPIPMLTDLVVKLHKSGLKVALIGGQDERAACNELLEKLDISVVDLAGKTSIRGTLGVLANLDLSVGGDTGLMHLAAAVGRPTLTVFSGNKPVTKWAHDYAPHRWMLVQGGDMNNLTFEELDQVVQEMLKT